MVLLAAVLLAATAASAASLDSTSTRCQINEFPFSEMGRTYVDKQLVGCGPSYSDNLLWNLDRADAISDTLATRRTRGKGAVVYVVDTGVEASHDEFQREGGTTNVIAGLDASGPAGAACPGDSATHPCAGGFVVVTTHGTAVASIVAGRTTGIAPDASIVAVRVISFSNASNQAVIFRRALDMIVEHAWAASTPPFQTAVVNMSSSLGFVDAEFEQKMRLMIGGVDKDFHADPNGKKFLFVHFAGNGTPAGLDPKSFPSQCTASGAVSVWPGTLAPQIDGLIAVGGIDRQNHLWSESCSGGVEILAPAEDILGASISGHDHYRGTVTFTSSKTTVNYASGTSYATPYVSGIAARLLEAEPSLTPAELESRIKASASYVSTENAPAGGRVAVLIEAPPPPKRRASRH